MLRYFRVLLLGGVIGSANVQAQLVNGDFASGDLTAWTASAVNQAGASVSPLIDVVPAGAENVARFMTGLFGSGPFISTLNQSFTISAAAPLLVFEFSLPSSVLDNSGTGNSQFSDSFTASLHNGVSTMSLLVVDKFGPVADPFGAAPGPVTLGQVQGPVYQYSFSADLSAMAGSTVSLFYDVSSADDGLASTFNLGGVELSSSDPKIPEPNTWRLFGLIGIAALGARLFKQKRATL